MPFFSPHVLSLLHLQAGNDTHESKQTRGRRASGASTRPPEPKLKKQRPGRSKSERKGGAKGSPDKLPDDLAEAGQAGMKDPFIQAMVKISKDNTATLAKA